MSKEINSAALGKFAEAVNTGNFALFEEVVATHCVDHDPASGQVPGPEGYRMFFTQMRTAFPISASRPKPWLPTTTRSPSPTPLPEPTTGRCWAFRRQGRR